MASGYDPEFYGLTPEEKCRLEKKLKEIQEDDSVVESRVLTEPSVKVITQNPHNRRDVDAAQERPPEVEWEYVDEEHDEMLLCGVCFTLLEDPQLLTCCGEQLICKQCLNKAHAANKRCKQALTCPFCRSERYKVVPNADIQTMIDNLKVWCPQKDDGCKWVGTIQEGKQHLTVCPFLRVNCPHNCGMPKFQRRHHSKHITECSAEPVSCLFSKIGCKEVVPRGEMKTHSKNDIHNHLLAIAKVNAELATQCRESMQSLDTGCDKTLSEKLTKVATLKKRHSQLNNAADSLVAKLRNIKKKRDSTLEENAQIGTQRTNQLQGQSNGAFRLRKLALGLQTHLDSLHGPVIEGYIPIPVTLTLDKFSDRKTNNDKWMSPPFYSHLGGYKMCLTVDLNGSTHAQDGKSTHISIYLHMMKGENDDRLVWPFPGAVITVLILNQRNTVTNMVLKSHGHARKYFYVHGRAWADVCKRVTDVTYGPGRGEHDFISHSQVGRYITNDTLKIKVHHIDFLPL